MNTKTIHRGEVLVVSLRLRVVISMDDYTTAYGPATKVEMREWVKATSYEAIENAFPPDVPVDVEEVS